MFRRSHRRLRIEREAERWTEATHPHRREYGSERAFSWLFHNGLFWLFRLFLPSKTVFIPLKTLVCWKKPKKPGCEKAGSVSYRVKKPKKPCCAGPAKRKSPAFSVRDLDRAYFCIFNFEIAKFTCTQSYIWCFGLGLGLGLKWSCQEGTSSLQKASQV